MLYALYCLGEISKIELRKKGLGKGGGVNKVFNIFPYIECVCIFSIFCMTF